MEKGLEFYKQFIDNLVQIQESTAIRRVKETGWPKTPDNSKINEFINSLSDLQKDVLCTMLQGERDGGIHDTLAYLDKQIATNNLQIVVDGTPLPANPFCNSMNYDWLSRCAGDDFDDWE